MPHGKHQGRKLAKRLKELWGARPMSGIPTSKWAKTMCHKIERQKAKQATRRELADQ